MMFCALKCEDSRISLWFSNACNSYVAILYSCTSESSCAISHDTITFTHVSKVLHFNAFLSHNLPYALSLTLSTVQKTINSHSTSSYSCHASVTTLNLQYSLITFCYKQLGHSHSPKMHYFQLVNELCVPRNTTPRVLHFGALVCSCITTALCNLSILVGFITCNVFSSLDEKA